MIAVQVFLILLNLFIARAAVDPQSVEYREKRIFVPALEELRISKLFNNFALNIFGIKIEFYQFLKMR